jgi:hypothetical protein
VRLENRCKTPCGRGGGQFGAEFTRGPSVNPHAERRRSSVGVCALAYVCPIPLAEGTKWRPVCVVVCPCPGWLFVRVVRVVCGVCGGGVRFACVCAVSSWLRCVVALRVCVSLPFPSALLCSVWLFCVVFCLVFSPMGGGVVVLCSGGKIFCLPFAALNRGAAGRALRSVRVGGRTRSRRVGA